MSVATVGSLTDVLTRLRQQLGSNELSLGPICTRVALRAGVDLRAPRPDQDRDPALVAAVVTALSEMGFAL